VTDDQRQRRVVTHPRTVATRVGSGMGPLPDLHDTGSLDDAAVRALMRSQLRLGLGYLTIVIVLLASLPLVLVQTNFFNSHSMFGIPLTWLIIGGGLFPIMIAIALFYNRAVERIESDLVKNSNQQ
jgi:hypothetical protein